VAINVKIDCSKKGRPKKRWKEVTDVDMKVRGLKRSDTVRDSNALETWLQKPAYPCMRRQQPCSRQMIIGAK